jgi:hypothetical protein
MHFVTLRIRIFHVNMYIEQQQFLYGVHDLRVADITHIFLEGYAFNEHARFV